MKKRIFNKPITSLLILLILIVTQGYSQSIKRQSIACYGSVSTTDNITFLQTAGQPFNTVSSYYNMSSILLGFQQPVKLKVEKINSVTISSLNLNIFPNPANLSVTIQSQEVVENVLIQVTDISGKIIYYEKVNELTSYSIYCENWLSGIYYINVIETNLSINSSKLIINK
jgi:hypothetical protein